MSHFKPFFFREYELLNTAQQEAIRCLLEHLFGHNIYEMQSHYIEEDLGLWRAPGKELLVPYAELDSDCRDRLAAKFELMVQAAAHLARSSAHWRIFVDARTAGWLLDNGRIAGWINIVVLDARLPDLVVLWKRIDLCQAQYFSLLALAGAIVEGFVQWWADGSRVRCADIDHLVVFLSVAIPFKELAQRIPGKPRDVR
jgi:hypothetical protein